MYSLPVSKVMLMIFEVWNAHLKQNIDLTLKGVMEVKKILLVQCQSTSGGWGAS